MSYDVRPNLSGAHSTSASADSAPRTDIVADLEKLFTASPELFNFYFPQLCNYVLRRLLNDDVTPKTTTRIELEGDDSRADVFGGGRNSPALQLDTALNNCNVEPLTLQPGGLDHFLLVRCATSKYLAHRIFWFIEAFLRSSKLPEAKMDRLRSLVATVRTSGSAMDRWTGIDPDLWDQLLWNRAAAGKRRSMSDPSAPLKLKKQASSSKPLLESPDEHAQGDVETSSVIVESDEESAGEDTVTRSLAGDATTKTSKTLARAYNTEWSSALSATPLLLTNCATLPTNYALWLFPIATIASARASTRHLEAEKPSSSLYLPVGVDVGGLPDRAFPRILGVVAEESFCFRTKERAPMFLCFEVVDVSPVPKSFQRKTSGLMAQGKLLKKQACGARSTLRK